MERQEVAKVPRHFATPEDEFSYLAERVSSAEHSFAREGHPNPRAAAAESTALAHRTAVPAHIIAESKEEAGGIDLPLSPELHDQKMGELISVLLEKGAWKAIAVAEATQSPHLIDDFHRILSAYLSEGYGGKGLARGSHLFRALSMVLYEITLPHDTDAEEKEGRKDLKELLASMEQFYQGMSALPSKDKNNPSHFVFELANPVGSSALIVYAAVPKGSSELFEKQLTASFPNVRLARRPDDYNVFTESGFTLGAEALFAKRGLYALKTYQEFTHDPLGAVLSAFGKLDRDREGASVQFVIAPQDSGLLGSYQLALSRINAGVSIPRATNIPQTPLGFVFGALRDAFFPPKKKDPRELHLEQNPEVENLKKKVSSPLLRVNIRLVASGETPSHAGAILNSLESAFKQFTDTAGNELIFTQVRKGALVSFARKVAFRMFDEKAALPLSTGELTAIAHLPPREAKSAPELKQTQSAVAPAPAELPQKGSVIGVNRYRGQEKSVRIAPEDRLRHLYLIGQTGTGKSTLLKNLVLQDIQSGAGVCMIDPHGSDVLEVLSAIPPERQKDVIYFDPGAVGYPMGLNMLEYDPRYPEQKSLVVDELLGIFKKLFGATPESMGPAFEQYFRNAALLVMDDPESGSTLLDISRIFSDPAFRTLKLSRCKNPVVAQFWKGIALQAQGEQAIENYGPYVTNKFDIFVSNEIIRPIIAQQQSAFNFRSLMDNRKILLVNLAKGRVGELNSNLLGLIIVGKFLIAALSRTDGPAGQELSPFYLHIDEFQNFTTNSIATILSEARKYKLSLTVAHQFIAQLTDEIRDAVFGNVGSLCAFRIGADDAEKLEKQFSPTFTAHDLMHTDNRSALVRLLIQGKPERPFSIETLPFMPGTAETIDRLREVSYRSYGRERSAVEAEIQARYAR